MSLNAVRDWLAVHVEGWEYGALALIAASVLFGTVALASFVEDVFFTSGRVDVTFLKDVAAPVHFAFLNPLATALVLEYYRKLSYVLTHANRYFHIPEEQLAKLHKQLEKHYKNPALPSLALLLSLLAVSLFFILRYYSSPSYYLFVGPTKVSASGLLTFLWATLITYILTLAGFKTIVTILALRALLKYPLHYAELHPDGCAGLRDLGTLAVQISMIILVTGAIISMFVISDFLNLSDLATFRILSSSVIFVAVIPPLFGLPLWLIHTAMKKRKQELLSQFANNHLGNRLETVSLFYAAIRDLPEWPVRARDSLMLVLSVLGSIVIPVVVAVTVE